jgi:anti-sigma B factor antagonist
MLQFYSILTESESGIFAARRRVWLSCYNSAAGIEDANLDGGCSMEISSKEFKHCDVIKVKGRVDSATAPQFSQALETITENGRFKVVVDMSELEYMSSAGFRALLATQRTCKRYNRGEVVLAAVPDRIHEALELAGFTELFKTFSDPLGAVGNF